MNNLEQIDKIKKNISDYKAYEYEIVTNPEKLFVKSFKEPLAFTNIGNCEEMRIQVTLDIENLRLITSVTLEPKLKKEQRNFAHYEYEVFNSLTEIVEFTEYMTFDSLISLNADEEDLCEFFGIEYIEC